MLQVGEYDLSLVLHFPGTETTQKRRALIVNCLFSERSLSALGGELKQSSGSH